jgi:membrane protease YdiL (CAAX protease family)
MITLFKTLKNLFAPDNKFIDLARSGKRITHIAVAIPFIIVFIIVGGIISYIPGQFLLADKLDPSEAFISFYNLFVSFGITIVLVWLWVKFFEKRSFKTLGFTSQGALKKYLKGFFVGLLMLSIVMVLISIFGKVQIVENPDPFNLRVLGIIGLLLIGYMVQGAAEEILARGWQFQVIAARYKPWLGAIISSVMFALLHGFNSGISPIALVNLFLFAILLLLFILQDRSIWAACGWHTSWNWALENIFGLKVSGSEGIVSIFKFSTQGPNYITGGDFGPEGSILTSFVLIGGMIFILIFEARKNK